MRGTRGATRSRGQRLLYPPPGLDLRFAETKSLTDWVSGSNLITFSRASSATFVGSNGVLQTAVTNLLLRSEEFNDASWGKTNSSITANSIASPGGTVTADALIENTSNGFHRISQTANVLSGLAYTFSVYIKTAGRNRVTLQIGSFPFAQSLTNFNLATGTVASGSGAIVALGDGWFRCSATNTATSTATGEFFVEITDSSGNRQYTGDGTSGIYLWGAQLEQSATVGEYVPTTSTINSAPRFDHNPLTGESLGLLVEEQRTNSIRNNTMVGAVAGTPGTLPTNWTYAVPGSGLTSSITGVGVENGISYIDFRVTGTSTSTTAVSIGIDNAAALTGQTWTSSAYFKLVAGSVSGITSWNLLIGESTSVGGFVAGSDYPVAAPTSTLIRSAVTRTLSGGASVALVNTVVRVFCTNGAAIDFTLRIGLPQLEQGAFATSPILTSGATATRSADVVSITGTNFSSWYNQSEGTFFVSGQMVGAASVMTFPRMVSAVGANVNNEEFCINWTAPSGSMRGSIKTPAGATVDLSPSPAIVAGDRYSVAFAASNQSARMATATSLSGLDSTVTMPNAVALQIGGPSSFQPAANTIIRRITYWPQRLPDTTLLSLTR